MSARNLVAALVVMAILVMAAARWPSASTASEGVPTAHVQRGRVETTVHATGEIRAARSTQMFTPTTGGQLQIVALAESGSAVKAGDVVVEFDSAEQQFNLEQARFDLAQAEQEIEKANATAAVEAAEDDVALMHARFDVRRAELDASANELVGSLQAKENTMLLEEARAKLAQLERDVTSKRESSRAAGHELQEKRTKADLAVRAAQQLIEVLRIRAPFDGYVTRRQNLQAFGGIIFSLAAMPEYRVGDAAFSGQPIADLIDASHVEASAKLTERDRTSVAAGEMVDVAIDGGPRGDLHGSVRSVSSVASRQIFDAGNRQFDVAIDLTGGRVMPGVTGMFTIHGQAFENVLYIPRAAIFDAIEKPTVYVRNGDGFVPHAVHIKALTETVAVVDDLNEHDEVALTNPRAPGRSRPAARSPAAPVTQRAAR